MNPAKIVVRKVQRQHSLEVLPFFTKPVRQSRESADRRSHWGGRFVFEASLRILMRFIEALHTISKRR